MPGSNLWVLFTFDTVSVTLAALRTISDPEESWTRTTRYFVFFHDECFECLAEGHKIELARCTFRNAISHVVTSLVGD